MFVRENATAFFRFRFDWLIKEFGARGELRRHTADIHMPNEMKISWRISLVVSKTMHSRSTHAVLCVGNTNCLPHLARRTHVNPHRFEFFASRKDERKKNLFLLPVKCDALCLSRAIPIEIRFEFFLRSRLPVFVLFRLQCEILPFVAHVNRIWICCRPFQKYPFVAQQANSIHSMMAW